MDYDIIVVGAGASGLMSAIAAGRLGKKVLVIDQKDKAGKKILATGNGKCNFTNLYQAPDCYRSDDSAFAMKVLSCFNVDRTIEFFEELGIYPKERNGYLYPNSEQAASVVQVLLLECKRLGVHFIYEETVRKIIKPHYTLITLDKENGKEKKYYGKKLILATGGCASPKLGSDGSGYNLAKSLGHTILKPLPALVSLRSPDKFCKTASGVRTMAKVEAYGNHKLLDREEGEIIFTDYGISGIPIMQLSRFVAKALDQGQKVYLKLDLLTKASYEEILSMLQNRWNQNKNKTMEELLIGLLNNKLAYVLIKEASLDPIKPGKEISIKEIKLLANKIKSFQVNIKATNPFDNAQVSAGGVSTKEINEETMESKLSKNLYLCGELVDVDGTCGGYNLQWAWSSGYLAGISAAKP